MDRVYWWQVTIKFGMVFINLEIMMFHCHPGVGPQDDREEKTYLGPGVGAQGDNKGIYVKIVKNCIVCWCR